MKVFGLPVTTYLTAAEVDNGNSGASDTIDFSASPFHRSTLTGNVTYTFTAPPFPSIIQLKIIQDGTGSRGITWPTINWAGGIPVSPTLAANAVTLVTLYYDGTSYWEKGVVFDLS